MNNDGINFVPEEKVEQKPTKMVQIAIMFQTDSDTDALSVKTAISESLKDRKDIAIHFTMHEHPLK